MRHLLLGLLLCAAIFYFPAAKAEEAAVAKEEEPYADLKPQATAEELYRVRKGDIVLGKKEAPITIVEYASMSCSHCASFHNDTLPKLKEKYIDTGKVALVFRDFPLDEPALKASMLVRCAEGDKREKFVSVMFRTQDNWVTKKNYLEVLSNIAKLGGMNNEAVEACLANKDVERSIMQSRLDAVSQLNISSTPSFYINGELHAGARPFDYFDKVLGELAEGKKAKE